MTALRRGAAAVVVLALGFVISAVPALAQGRGNGPHGQGRGPIRPGTTAVAPSPGQPTAAAVPLATWLDDASRLGRGDVWLGLSFARWSVNGTRVIFAPSSFFMIGVSDRIGLGASVPVYHLRDETGLGVHGVSDVAIFGKVGVVDPEKRPVGLAVAPVVVLQDGDGVTTPVGRHAVWAVPISLEMRGRAGRLYGSAGYFSHGAAFFNTAVELTLSQVLALGGTFGAAVSTRGDAVAPSLRSRRMDASASLFVVPSTSLTLSFSVGHAFSGDAAVDGGPWLAAGLSLLRSR